MCWGELSLHSLELLSELLEFSGSRRNWNQSDNRRNMTIWRNMNPGNWVHSWGWYLSQDCSPNKASTWGPDTRTRVGFLWPSPYIQGRNIKQVSGHKTWGLCCRCLLVGSLVWFIETGFGYVTQANLELTILQINLNSPSYFSVPSAGHMGLLYAIHWRGLSCIILLLTCSRRFLNFPVITRTP